MIGQHHINDGLSICIQTKIFMIATRKSLSRSNKISFSWILMPFGNEKKITVHSCIGIRTELIKHLKIILWKFNVKKWTNCQDTHNFTDTHTVHPSYFFDRQKSIYCKLYFIAFSQQKFENLKKNKDKQTFWRPLF